jgi:hypothetical protein
MSLAGEIPSLQKSAIDMRMPYLVSWIRSGFNTNPDPAKQMRIHADPNLDLSNFAIALQKAVQHSETLLSSFKPTMPYI